MRSTFVFLVLNFLIQSFNCDPSPYKVLGVNPKATDAEITKAYKRLAKEWHPDKNTNPEAKTKFVEIASAYETLSEPEKRRQYDRHGTTSNSNGRRSGFRFSNMNRFHFRTYNDDEDFSSFSVKMTEEKYEYLVENSLADDIWLIQIYSDYRCPSCRLIQDAWQGAAETLYGIVKTAKVSYDVERSLARRLGVRNLPSVVGIKGGNVYAYRGSLGKGTTAASFVNFAENLFSSNIKILSSVRQTQSFIESTYETPKVIMLSNREKPHILFHQLADAFQESLKMAHVHISSSLANSAIASHLEVPTIDLPAFVILKEKDSPAQFIDKGISDKRNNLEELLEHHIYLHIPEFTFDNFYSLCYGGTICIAIFSPTIEDARKVGLPVVDTKPPNMQLGWVDPTQQKDFFQCFIPESGQHENSHQSSSESKITVVAFNAEENQFLVYEDDTDSFAISRWLQLINEQKLEMVTSKGITYLSEDYVWLSQLTDTVAQLQGVGWLLSALLKFVSAVLSAMFSGIKSIASVVLTFGFMFIIIPLLFKAI